ncbi:hypothetical protein DL96DRAFT_1561344 [Flagelloscypha sp. PMI_526]|nr:hypothetical protein DL96DRAFT_1561344 [Flagelloscypha sp. PMI_526]
MTATSLSIQEVAEKFNDISDVAYLYNLDTLRDLLVFRTGLDIIHYCSRKPWSSSPPPNTFPFSGLESLPLPHSKRLRFVILIQTVFVTLRFSCQLGENIVAFKQRRLLLITDNGVEKINNSLVATSRIGWLLLAIFLPGCRSTKRWCCRLEGLVLVFRRSVDKISSNYGLDL